LIRRRQVQKSEEIVQGLRSHDVDIRFVVSTSKGLKSGKNWNDLLHETLSSLWASDGKNEGDFVEGDWEPEYWLVFLKQGMGQEKESERVKFFKTVKPIVGLLPLPLRARRQFLLWAWCVTGGCCWTCN
jgi:hypothetical protein